MLEAAPFDDCNTQKLKSLNSEDYVLVRRGTYLLLPDDFDALARFHCGLFGFELGAEWLL